MAKKAVEGASQLFSAGTEVGVKMSGEEWSGRVVEWFKCVFFFTAPSTRLFFFLFFFSESLPPLIKKNLEKLKAPL